MDSLKPQLILAPLQGYTDVTFRNVFSAHFSGFSEAVAPFISTMGQQRLKPSRIKDVWPENNTRLTVIPQILGNVAQDFVFLADHLNKMGHETVNWNLGCPHSKIAKKNRGSGLLQYPDLIDAFLKEVIPQLPCRLSIKMRLGRKSKDEIDHLLPVLDQYPLEEIILHPRTGEQMYTGTSDQDAFIKATTQSRHAFVYNGDITSVERFNVIREKCPRISRFMIGRGIISNPLLAEQICGIQSDNDPVARIKSFHDDLFEAYKHLFSGPGHLTGRMKGFWTYLGPSFKGHKKPLKKILKSKSIEAYTGNVKTFFDTVEKFEPGQENFE